MPYLKYNAKRFWLSQTQVTIGSSEANFLSFKGKEVQPTHALIEEYKGAFWISAINRFCTVLVNGRKVKRQVLLDQDQITIDEHNFVYHFLIDRDDIASLADQSQQNQSVQTKHQQEQERQDERLLAYQRLFEFSHILAEKHHSTEIFETMLDQLVRLTKADHGFVVNTQYEQLELCAAIDRYRFEQSDFEVNQLSASIVDRVCQSREPVLENNLLETESPSSSESILELGLCSVMCVPLLFQGELLGVLYVGSRQPNQSFSQADLKSLYIFGAQAATLLKHALNQEILVSDNQRLKGALESFKYGSVVGSSPVMQQVFNRIDRVSQNEINLLIMGESGTGKELIAREVHRRSRRSEQAFVAINCGALPSTLIESELFGYREGAFTGAISNKKGSLEQAQGGTLFLDEIGELSLEVQVKLLRVIEERAYTPLGAHHLIPLDIRLICATNRNLHSAVNEGRFRLDLYYRINSFELTLPPLRERGEDIILLAKYILERASQSYERPNQSISLEAQQGIRRYSWPGNIRELENRIAQAVILSDHNEISLRDLNLSPELLNDQLLSLKEAQERFSQDYVQHVLSLNQGNRTQAARDLGVDPRTVFRYLEKRNSEKV